MKAIRFNHAVCAMLVCTAFALALSGCSMEPTVKAQSPAAINSMLFGTSNTGLASSQVGTTIFIQTRDNDPVNTDAYSIPMPSHAVLSHLHFATTLNNLNAAMGTVSVYVNGVPNVIACTVAASQMECSDTTHSITVNEGDLVTIGMTMATTSSTNSGGLGPWRASVGVAFQ
jgi:hypothetical protein